MCDEFESKDNRNVQKHADKNHKNVFVKAQIILSMQKKDQQKEKQGQIELAKTEIKIDETEKTKNLKGKRKNRKESFSSDDAKKNTVDVSPKKIKRKTKKEKKKVV